MSNTNRAIRLIKGKRLIMEQTYAQRERLREQLSEHLGDYIDGWPKKVTGYLHDLGIRFNGALHPFEDHDEHLQHILKNLPEVGAYLYMLAQGIKEIEPIRVRGNITIRTPFRKVMIGSKRLRMHVVIHTHSSTTTGDFLKQKMMELDSVHGDLALKSIDRYIHVVPEPVHTMVETILQKQLMAPTEEAIEELEEIDLGKGEIT